MFGLGLGIGIGGGGSPPPPTPAQILGSAIVLDLDTRFATFVSTTLTAAQDQSGNHNDGTATTVTYSANGGVKGLPKFVMTTTNFLTGANNIVAAGAARTMIAVVAPSGAGGAVFTSRTGLATNCLEYKSANSGEFASDEVANNTTGAAYVAGLHCLIWKWQTGAPLPSLLVDGVSQTAAGANPGNESGAAGYRIGTSAGGRAGMPGDFYRCIAVNRFTTSPEDAQLRTAMQYLYGTP